MKYCKLCEENEANKKNTHYLTDSIIRSALNKDGSNEREKGFYFGIDSSDPFIRFNFQRIDGETLESVLGRDPTDEELEKARSIPFSVDYYFCSECEKRFTEIENDFISKILPNFRQKDLTGLSELKFREIEICRLFFVLQVYRSAECDSDFKISAKLKEKLRIQILERKPDFSIPLSVSYLQTIGGDIYYTENSVGYVSGSNPSVIFMNDFVVQIFDNDKEIKYEALYGLNSKIDFEKYLNINEEEFLFKIFSVQQKRELFEKINIEKQLPRKIEYFKKCFELMWFKIFNYYPNEFQKVIFLSNLVSNENDKILKLTEEQVMDFTKNYLNNLIRNYR